MPQQRADARTSRAIAKLAWGIFTPILVFGLKLTLAPPAAAKDVELAVGIVQRFGSERTDNLIISSSSNNLLDFSFVPPGSSTPKTVRAKEIKLFILMQSLQAEQIEERLVLSDRATFETAEHSANNWRKLGIEVEITQPGRWQVWAKRDVYNTPILRRWLLQSLQAKGYERPYLETSVLTKKPEAIAIIDGEVYRGREFNISSPQELIFVKNNGRRLLYGGSLKLQPNAYGNFTLVNLVALETYLRGVVPYEIGVSAPRTAIEAQSIIARTYALRNLRRFAADGYQLCATIHCQVYKGLKGATARTDRAIVATSSKVLTYQNQLADALYYSTSGGVTAPFNDTWNGESRSYLQAKIDSTQNVWDLAKNSLSSESNLRRFIALKRGFNETGSSVFRWSRQRSLSDLNGDLRKYLTKIKHPLAEFETIETMQVTERSHSGRILSLTVTTDLGQVILDKTEARSAFKPPRSTLFYLDPLRDSAGILTGYTFIGGGFGHGVGLSQRGSYNLSRLGWSAAKILEFYYPGTTIETINDSLVFWPASAAKNDEPPM